MPNFLPSSNNIYWENDMCSVCTQKLSSSPKVFGPPAWNFLHTLSLNYPINPDNNTRLGCISFIQGLAWLLPCKYCSQHARDFVSGVDLQGVSSSRDKLFEFFWNFHNSVNTRLGKRTMSLDDAKKMYQFGYECKYGWLIKTAVYMIILVLVAIVFYQLGRKK